jgi:4-amino-4-deoxy-L-arabinose transferase-like glycosyltransferase
LPERSGWTVRVALALVILGSCVLAAGCWRIYTNTWDEPEHIAAGIELLDKGHYEYDTEHPPLARVLLALGPFLAGAHSFGTPPPDGTQEGKDILYADGHYDLYLTLARAGNLPFLVLLLLATWLWARRLFASDATALLALVLLISVPPILGHAALATLDVAAAATCLLALYTLENWLASGRWEEAVLFGVTSGIAIATKFSAVPFIALSLLALGLVQGLNSWRATRGTHEHHPWRVLRSRATGAVLAGLAALVPLLAAYAVRSPDVSGVEVRFDWAVNYLISQGGLARALGSWLSHAWLPRELTDLVNGVIAVKAHNDAGHRSYLLGQVSLDGWWYFYLVTLAVKTPLPLLAGGSLGLACLAGKGWRARDGWALAPLVLVLAILGFASVFSRINIGIRHVLILYPFLALGGAYLAWRAWRACRALGDARLRLGATMLLAALLLWQVSTLWRAYPDYLPYFNETVREPRRVLVDSDLDWGQDLRRLEIRAAQLHIGKLSLAYNGTADLAREPLPPFEILKAGQPVSGWVAISALARTRRPSDYAWLDAYRPLERIGHTIDLYYIP